MKIQSETDSVLESLAVERIDRRGTMRSTLDGDDSCCAAASIALCALNPRGVD